MKLNFNSTRNRKNYIHVDLRTLLPSPSRMCSHTIHVWYIDLQFLVISMGSIRVGKYTTKLVPWDWSCGFFLTKQGSLYYQPKERVLLRRNPSRLPYICLVWFPPKWVPFNDPSQIHHPKPSLWGFNPHWRIPRIHHSHKGSTVLPRRALLVGTHLLAQR